MRPGVRKRLPFALKRTVSNTNIALLAGGDARIPTGRQPGQD
ncbi:hypothetical protein SL1157_3302 [Ruegeria lacuscaerulensis ITI-1157]|nr:hypothetical protein SL1157_3302 [Ruegeria lacuscaerulensis ITI-1157]